MPGEHAPFLHLFKVCPSHLRHVQRSRLSSEGGSPGPFCSSAVTAHCWLSSLRKHYPNVWTNEV